jgi:anti-anti-sigma factor
LTAGVYAIGGLTERKTAPIAIHGELIVEKVSGVWLLKLRGEHDIATAHNLDAQLEAVFLHGTSVIVDLSEAQFIDSSIVAAIFRGLRLAEAGRDGVLVVCAPPGSFARRVFDQASLADVVQTFDSRRDAMAWFESR